MSFADELREKNKEKVNEKKDIVKEYYKDILKKCSDKANCGKNGLTYTIPESRSQISSSQINNDIAEKIASMLRDGGMCVEVDRTQVYCCEVCGRAENYSVLHSEKKQEKTHKECCAPIGTQYIFNIEW